MKGPAAVSAPSKEPITGGDDAGAFTVSLTLITSVIVKVLLVAVPIFSRPPAVLAPELVKAPPVPASSSKDNV